MTYSVIVYQSVHVCLFSSNYNFIAAFIDEGVLTEGSFIIRKKLDGIIFLKLVLIVSIKMRWVGYGSGPGALINSIISPSCTSL